MSATANQTDGLLDEASVMKVVETMGGPGAILEDLGEFRRVVDRLWEERAELMERYPERWVAVGMEGVVAVGDSMRDVLDTVEARGLREREVVVEHLQANPPVLILQE